MLTLPHVLVGAAIGSQLSNPYAVGLLSFVSHFVLDSVPHWQEPLYPYIPTKATYIRVSAEIVSSVVFLYFFTRAHSELALTMWIGAIAASAPDLDNFLVYAPKLLKNKLVGGWWNFHCRIQRETASFLGLLPQLVVSVVALFLILK